MILHLIETGGPGGAEQMLLRLADEYGRRGISQMVCLRKDGWLAGEVRQRNLPLKIFPVGSLPDIVWLRELRKLARKCGFTGIHAHEFAMNVRGAMLGRWLGIPVVSTVHGIGYFGDKWQRRLAYQLTSRGAHFIAVSEDIRRQLINKCGVRHFRVSVIPNGVDLDRFRFDMIKRQVFRKQFGVKYDQVLLGTIGSYYPVKGHKYLIEAMKRLVAMDRNVKLVMAGQGPLANELRKQTSDSGLGEFVRIVGYVEDTPGFLSSLDIFVLPSLSEGMPLALLEAGANGRCVLATNVGGIPEIIINQENGVLVPPGNVEALTYALTGLLDPSRRFILAANLAETVKKDWSIQLAADRYLALLLPSSPVGTSC